MGEGKRAACQGASSNFAGRGVCRGHHRHESVVLRVPPGDLKSARSEREGKRGACRWEGGGDGDERADEVGVRAERERVNDGFITDDVSAYPTPLS